MFANDYGHMPIFSATCQLFLQVCQECQGLQTNANKCQQIPKKISVGSLPWCLVTATVAKIQYLPTTHRNFETQYTLIVIFCLSVGVSKHAKHFHIFHTFQECASVPFFSEKGSRVSPFISQICLKLSSALQALTTYRI